MPLDDIESGDPAELSGLLVVQPDQGNADPANGDHSGDTAASDNGAGGDDGTEVDWNSVIEDDNPDDGGAGADDETPDDGGDGPDADGGDTNDDTQPHYTVTVDGKQERVPLKELIAGYSRTADYTRKTTEVAETRKVLEAEAAAVRESRAQYKQYLDILSERVGPAANERTPEQWAQLRAENPETYAVEWADAQMRKEQRAAIDAEKQRVAKEEQGELVVKMKAFVADQRTKFETAMAPHWKGKDGKTDPKKRAEVMTAISNYAVESGFTPEEVKTAYDSRVLTIAHKAMLWDNHQKALKAAKQKLADAPDMPAPGSRVPQQGRKSAVKAEAQKKFERSGRVDDALPLMFK